MSAAIINLFVEQGSYFCKRFVYKPGGVGLDLTDYTARCQVRRNAQDSVVAAEGVIAFIEPRDGAENLGAFDLIFDEATTSAMEAGKDATDKASLYVYDVELISASNRVKRVVKGTFTLDPEVTKDDE